MNFSVPAMLLEHFFEKYAAKARGSINGEDTASTNYTNLARNTKTLHFLTRKNCM